MILNTLDVRTRFPVDSPPSLRFGVARRSAKRGGGRPAFSRRGSPEGLRYVVSPSKAVKSGSNSAWPLEQSNTNGLAADVAAHRGEHGRTSLGW